jgi:hypothetical protein
MWSLMMAAALAFPDVPARDLDGRTADVRRLEGAPALIALGFSLDSRRDVEPWTTWAIAATGGRLPVVVMPVYGPMPGVVREMVDGTLRRSVEAPLRRNVWTTTARDALVSGLRLDGGERSAIVLIDGRGRVQYVATGAPTAAAKQALLAQWKAIAPGMAGR